MNVRNRIPGLLSASPGGERAQHHVSQHVAKGNRVLCLGLMEWSGVESWLVICIQVRDGEREIEQKSNARVARKSGEKTTIYI